MTDASRHPVVAVGHATRSYGSVAWCYDGLAAGLSAGGIERSKLCHLHEIAPGERVLVAGVGSGSDAVAAACRGAEVVGIDVSPEMLARLERRARRTGCRVRAVQIDLFDHRPETPYDVVLAPYVLNVFDEREARAALVHLLSLLRPGGRLFISDFAPERAARILAGRIWIQLYYGAIDLAGAVLGLAPIHAIHDYAAWLPELGAEITHCRRFAIWPGGPPQFESLGFRRSAAP